MISSRKIKFTFLASAMLSLLFSIAGCSKETPKDDIDGANSANFILNLSIAGEANADNRIESLRLIIFNEDNKALIKNIVFTPADVYEQVDQKYVLQANIKWIRAVRYFVIANEPSAWNLDNGISYTSIKALETNYYNSATNISDVKAPFLMFAQCDQAVETPSGSLITKDLSLVRNVVKVTLKLKQTLALPGSGTALVTLNKIHIDRVPKKGFLFPDKIYNAANTYTKTAEINLTASDFEISNDYSTLKNDLVLYIPEHLLTDKNNYTCIRISGTQAGLSTDVLYEIVLSDGAEKLYRPSNPVALADMTTSDLSITRNTHFIVNATITPEIMKVEMDLIPWKDGGNIDVEGGGLYYLNLSDAYVTYPHKLYIDKDKNPWIKDENGAYVAPSAVDYYCYFWTNRAASTVEISDFKLDQDPTQAHNITNSLAILRDSPNGLNHDVMGKVDVHIPAEDVVKGFLKSYSMRLKNDKIDRKLTFAISDYDFIADVIAPSFTKITDLVITDHGKASATCTNETFEIEAFLPKGTELFAISSVSGVRFTCAKINPTGTDIFSPIKHKVTYTSNSPRRQTLGDHTVRFEIRRGNTVVYNSPLTLSFTIKTKTN